VDLVDSPLVDDVTDRPSGPRRGRLILWLLAGIAALATVLLVGDDFGGWWAGLSRTLANPEAFRAWVEGLGAWGPIGYLLAQTAQVVVVPIPGTLFPPVGALAFGPWPALALSLVGMALGSAVVFLVARRWGRPLAVRLVGTDRIQRYESLMTARGGLLIWLVFLLPFLPDDAVCALAGLSGIGFRRFMVIATVGRIPAVAAGVFTMSGLEGAPAWVWAMAAAGFVGILWAGARFGPAIERRIVGLSRAPRRDPEETGGAPTPSSARPEPGSGHRLPGRSHASHPDAS
jgi:uncharacterized membrane protein YdjX (TVP38/TMEM64 family)